MWEVLLLFAASLAPPGAAAPYAATESPKTLQSVGAARWPAHFALTGTRSEIPYVYAVSLVRDGDEFVLAGGAPMGETAARITVRVDARGRIAGSDARGRRVVCAPDGRGSCTLPLHGFLATAAAVAALRRGVSLPLVALGPFAGRRVACVDGAALESAAGEPAPVVDPCLDTATGAVLAFRHRRSGRYEGASLDPESIRLEVGRSPAARSPASGAPSS